MMDILGVPRGSVAFAWRFVREYVESACLYSGCEYTHKNLRSKCMNDPAHSLYSIVEDGRVIGCMVTERGDSTLHVVSLGGNLPDGWRDKMFSFLCDLAKSSGARRITLRGRRGWGRYIRALGFKPSDDGLLEVTI